MSNKLSHSGLISSNELKDKYYITFSKFYIIQVAISQVVINLYTQCCLWVETEKIYPNKTHTSKKRLNNKARLIIHVLIYLKNQYLKHKTDSYLDDEFMLDMIWTSHANLFPFILYVGSKHFLNPQLKQAKLT